MKMFVKCQERSLKARRWPDFLFCCVLLSLALLFLRALLVHVVYVGWCSYFCSAWVLSGDPGGSSINEFNL